MKEKNNIDELFRDKLEGFSEEPPAFIWDGIREQLATGIRRKRVVWYRWSAVAALAILAFLAGWYFNETSDKVSPQVAKEELLNPENEKSMSGLSSEPVPTAKETEKVDKEQNANFLAEAKRVTQEKNNETSDANLLKKTETDDIRPAKRVLPPDMIKPVEASIVAQINPEPLVKTSIAEKEAGLSVFEKETVSKNATLIATADREKAGWRMGVNISPGYSSYTATHAESYATNMTHEASDGNTNLSGGFSVRYRTSGRWSFESGVYYAQNGQQTGSSPQVPGSRHKDNFASAPAERLYFNTAVSMDNSRIAMNSTAGIIEIENMPAGAEIAANLENADTYQNSLITQGEFSQVFDLMEIPLNLRYLLIESKLDVELIGGINAGVVVGNNAFIENQFGVQKIGKTRDINSVNVSGTFGLGFTYALGKQFSLALEPRFNYYMNSISNNPEVNFKPYRIGMYTGLYYSF